MNNTKFNFHDLDEKIRALMIDEMNFDINNTSLYYSSRFNVKGKSLYPELLLEAIRTGDEFTLAIALKSNGCFQIKEFRGGKMVNVPVNAHMTFSEGEFNRYYIRAVARRAIDEKRSLVIYRARYSEKPREDSIRMVGKSIEAEQILKDLRKSYHIDEVLGFPPGPNSGLSVKLA